jgi:hypothetical protein
MSRKPPRRPAMDPDVRVAVLRRDNYTCQAKVRGYAPEVACAGRNHVHHVVLRSQGAVDSPDDLLTVCLAHHDHLHNVDRAGAEAFGLVRRVGPLASPPGGG